MDGETAVINESVTFCRPRTIVMRQRGFTLNEFFVLLGVLAIIVGLAVPGILRERAEARNEEAAIHTLRTLVAAQAAFATSCGSGGYASGISQLQTQIEPQHAGYSFAIRSAATSTTTALDCRGIPTLAHYVLTAEPQKYRTTGGRSFAATSDGMIWEVDAARAPDEPFAESATRLE